MKKFLKIFIFLEIILFAYIFNTSIYNIYEKNNISSENLKGYVLEETSPEILDKFYTIFTEEYSQNKLELINNTLTSTDKSVYDLYCYPLNEFVQKQPISNSILLQYHELQKEDFLDSVGVFYTDLRADEIKEIASQLSVAISDFENEAIPYSMVLKLNLFNFVILYIVLQIIYCIYTSYSLKKIGIKKSMGFSTVHILKEQIASIIKYFVVICSVLICLLNLYYALTNRFEFSYLATSILFFTIVLAINIICVLITSILIKFVSLEAMIKNKTLNSGINIIVQAVKIVFSVIITITIISLLNQGNSFKQSQQAVLDYKYLDGYYTANGFNSSEYDYALANIDILESYSKQTLEMYNHNHSLLCDFRKHSASQTSRPYYEQQLVIANRNYLSEFSNIQLNGKPLGEDIFNEPTVLVPHKYKSDENSIKEYIKQEYFRLMNYDQFYKIPGEEKNIDKFNVVYIDDDSTIKVNTENGFSDMTDPIIIVDTGDFGGLYYLDSLNRRCLFFQMESREEFSSLLAEYNFEKLVTAGTLLTPYLMQLENVKFVLKTLTMFTIVFIVSLLFILYISNYVDIVVNRKRYAAKEILGFSHFRTLKNRYIFWGIELIISGVLTVINYYFACLFAIILIDYIFCELLYRVYILNSLYEIEKGA
ncbi:hypothetical protein JFE40_08395 [Enterococcus faecium]|uniref:Bacteriocin-associated integral membrane protein n=1 Tax=Anaerococcus tetradius TaxID=33036 RepID=A0A133KCR7_9FIRM|nr:hypothetical protein [Anaerococcus tetradius]KWZ77378.1 bacteriocin-associated integral membrane protein [Anaerococcus tetradius]MBJ0796869.1 hypothetical protein [Enterococcus faecium]